jgi:hypothetical protein
MSVKSCGFIPKDNKGSLDTLGYRVYVEEEEEGLKVFVHRLKNDTKEQLPLAYIYGFNALFMGKREKS